MSALPKPLLSAPKPLHDLPGWLLWRFEREGLKVPYYVNGNRRHGVNGKPEDRRQLTTFEIARAAALRGGYNGIGFATLPEFNITALDFDHCATEGLVRPEVLALITEGYSEFSPSGNGVRAFVQGQLGNRKSSAKKHGFGFETFSTKGWVTVTGHALDHVELLGLRDTVPAVPSAVRALFDQRFGDQDRELSSEQTRLGLVWLQLEEALEAIDPDTDHDEWRDVGMALHHETQGEAFDLWDSWSERGEKYPGTDELRKRWDSFGRHEGRSVTARTLLKICKDHGGRVSVNHVATADDFDAAQPEVPTPEGETKPPGRFAFQRTNTFAQGKPPGWWIKGLLPKADLAVLFGESGSGKSFMALDLVGAIAQGKPWRNMRTKQTRVAYICAEGAGGFRARLKAYTEAQHITLDALDVWVMPATPNFLLKPDITEVAKEVKTLGQVGIVVVDTAAQVTPGANENSSEDMGKALAHCRFLNRATGATVLLIHHSGKDASKGARGWSGLKAAADAELEVLRTPGGRVLKISKLKDGNDEGAFGFDLEQHQVGVDEDGDSVSSCVVVESAVPVVVPVGRKLGKVEHLVLEVVTEFSIGQNAGIEVDHVIQEAARRMDAPEKGRRDTRKQLAKRALQRLADMPDGPVFVDEDEVGLSR